MIRKKTIAKALALTPLVFLSLVSIRLNSQPRPEPAENDPKIAQAPQKARALKNPLAGNPDAAAAGRKLYVRFCASCHGANAQGQGKAPDLRGPIVHEAAPGALFWFLKNGDMKQGMPSWSRLPDPQLWQLVTFLQSLQ
ncbi:MAG TPA: cytochrome c [Terriglobia bacterium]|jgi:cytochrome c oxidase cbb3-type subunit 2|nr:cytochrome c [Terriglobia bacterium]